MSKQSLDVSKGSFFVGLSALLLISLSLGTITAPARGDDSLIPTTPWTESSTPAPAPVIPSPIAGDASATQTASADTASSPVATAPVDETPIASKTVEPLLPSGSDLGTNTPEPPAADSDDTDQAVMPLLVPNPGTNQAVITVKVGDTRTTLTSVGGLVDVRLGLFANAGDAVPVPGAWSTCTSDASGDCSFIVPNVARTGNKCSTGTAGANCDRQFWVKQISAPDTHYINTTLGPTGGEAAYAFRTGVELRPGTTYRSTSNFMYGTGNANYVASSGVWQNSRRNPSFPDKCGINVGLVLDLSNSVTASDLAQMKRAASGFVDVLTGTPSQVGLFTFATNAPASAGDTLGSAPVSSEASANTVKGKINGYRLPGGQAGGTNWDRGLYQVVQSGSDFDVVMVITDGNPTFSGNGVGPGGATRFTELENGIFSANAIKARASKIIAFGVGAGVSSPSSSLNLRSISGQVLDRDYYKTNDYAQAGAQLRDLALSNCKGSVSVVKEVIPPGGTIADASPAGGWTFRGNGSQGVAVDSPSILVTNAETGAANFPLSFAVGTSSAPVTLTETPQAGFTLEQVAGRNATCTRVDTGAEITTTNTVNGFTVAADIGYPVSCTVYNRALQSPTLTLVKKVEPGSTGATDTPSAWTLTATGPTAISGPGSSPAVTNRVANAGTYTLTESGGPAGYVASKWSCTGGRLSGNKLTLTYGDNATCTITNTAGQARLTLVKTVTNDSGGTSTPNAWTLTATGPTTGLSGSTGATAVTGRLVEVGSYALAEAGPGEYNAGGWSCSAVANGVTVPVEVLENSIVRVGVGQDVTCTINNDDQTRMVIEKWGASAQGVIGPMDGARFEVRENVSSTPGEVGSPGEVVGSVTAVPGQTGVFRAAAFDPGLYWLLETRAPQGNTLLAAPVSFRIETDGTLTLLGESPQAEIVDNGATSLVLRITDVAAIELPLSGGAALNFVALTVVVLGICSFGVVLIRRQTPHPSSAKG